MNKHGYIYIVSNAHRNVLYIGVTSNLEQRIYQHKHRLIQGFSKRYNCTDLLWWEISESIVSAITREKQLKGWPRKRKDSLIASVNPKLEDLAPGLFGCN